MMRDHRHDHDPTPVDITERLRSIADANHAVRLRPIEGAATRKKKTTKKARRKTVEQSRRNNR